MDANPQVTGDEPMYGRLRRNVELLAEMRGWTINRTAGVADLSRQTLRNWLYGKASPTLRNLEELARVLGVDVSDLLMETDELQEKVGVMGLNPFVLSPGSIKEHSISGASDKSGPDKRRRGKIPPTGRLVTSDLPIAS